jgi:XRE family transcriptional regulator, fatty acid utilization regulator
MAKTPQEKIITGLKLRQYRQEAGWSFDELSKRTGISVSYLNEIEKGKKSPQTPTLVKIADAFGVKVSELTSSQFSKQLAPIGALIESNFLDELPFEIFGISTQQVVEIMARAPERVHAFISAMIEIAKNYSFRQEHFFLAALRAYQEMNMNYFPEIEAEAYAFIQEHQLERPSSAHSQRLEEILLDISGCVVDDTALDQLKELKQLRSVFVPKDKKLLLQSGLIEAQRAFQIAKEIGFQVLKLKKRPLTSTLVKVNSFDQVLNNYKAAYFAVSVLVPEKAFIADLKLLFQATSWQAPELLKLLQRYSIGPEVFFQRFNVLSKEFGLHKVFFLRLIHNTETGHVEIDKELHLNRRHTPHSNGLREYYCRRWVGIQIFDQLDQDPAKAQMHAGVNRMQFVGAKEEYLCISVAKYANPILNRQVSIMIGIEIDEVLRKTVRWWNDAQIAKIEAGVTCDRCSIQNCTQRMAEPTVLERIKERKGIEEALKRLTE